MLDDPGDLDVWLEAYLAGRLAVNRLLPVLRRAEARMRGTMEPVHCALRELYVSVDEAADAVDPELERRAVVEAAEEFWRFRRS
ncbi:MAG TPA: hypothetical protein VHR85_10940 [Nocardioides sp.]|nr:hypothetical protein [Nocardioides sp.]